MKLQLTDYFKAHTVSNGIPIHYMLCDNAAAPALNILYTCSLEEQAYWFTPWMRLLSSALSLSDTFDYDWCWTDNLGRCNTGDFGVGMGEEILETIGLRWSLEGPLDLL